MAQQEARPPEPVADEEPSAADLRSSTLGVVGTGVMAEAIIAGLLRRGLVGSERVICSHPRPARAREVEDRFQVRVVSNNDEVARRADILLLAVKPQVLPRV